MFEILYDIHMPQKAFSYRSVFIFIRQHYIMDEMKITCSIGQDSLNILLKHKLYNCNTSFQLH